MSERLNRVTRAPDQKRIGEYQQGEMGQATNGTWLICCPLCSSLGELRNHQVIQHEDKTITVTPSLICHGSIYGSPGVYHPCTAHYFIVHNVISWCG